MGLLITTLLALFLAGCSRPMERPKCLFEEHWRFCPQCSKPTMSPDGTENSLCEEGFRLFQEDVRRAYPKTTDTGPR